MGAFREVNYLRIKMYLKYVTVMVSYYFTYCTFENAYLSSQEVYTWAFLGSTINLP
jgi:hypothetical protein